MRGAIVPPSVRELFVGLGRYATPAEVAEKIGWHAKTLIRWSREGTWPRLRVIGGGGGRPVFVVEEVIRHLEAAEQEASA